MSATHTVHSTTTAAPVLYVGKRPVNRIFKTATRRGIMFGAPSCRTRTRRA